MMAEGDRNGQKRSAPPRPVSMTCQRSSADVSSFVIVQTPAMEFVVGVAVVVAGWLVNEFFSRRSARRNLRVEYLLSAFRRLEYASNRRMSSAHKAAVEEAVSDIQLLGSPAQVQKAIEFAREFASNQQASTEPLLLDLRASLRKELQLDPVPPQRVWLRFDNEGEKGAGPAVGEGGLTTWEKESLAVEANIRSVVPTLPTLTIGSEARPRREGLTGFAVEMLEESERSSPIGALAACERHLSAELRAVLEADGASAPDSLSATQLASLAKERDLIDKATRDGVQGLEVMHSMALLDDGGRRLTDREVRQFVDLTDGLLHALRLPRRR